MESVCIAGVEIALGEGGASTLGAELARGWQGYRGRGGAPDIVVTYRAVSGFQAEQPPEREYPGYGARLVAPGEIALQRRDARGTIRLAPGAPMTVAFEGIDAPYALEAVLRLALSFMLPARSGLVLHASGVVTPAPTRSLLFLGPSGAGKSTIAGLLAPLPRLGDDLVAVVRRDDGRFVAHATPFSGEIGPAADGAAPLGALYFLKQASIHGVTPLPRGEGLRRLLRNVMIYAVSADTADRVLDTAAELMIQVPGFLLEFAKDPGVAAVLPVT